jgi:hypothetical protein
LPGSHWAAAGPEIYGGAVAWRADEAPRVLEMFREAEADAPPELALVAVMRIAPPAPWLAPEVHGQPIVMLLACHTGDVAKAEKQLAPVKAFGKPVGDILQRRPYVTQQSLLDATQPRGRRYYWKSEYLPGIEKEMLAKVMEHAARIRSPNPRSSCSSSAEPWGVVRATTRRWATGTPRPCSTSRRRGTRRKRIPLTSSGPDRRGAT